MTAGIGLAIMYINLTCIGIIYGLNASLADYVHEHIETEKWNIIGEYINRARALNLLIMIPMSVFIFFASNFFTFIGIDETSSNYAYRYMVTIIPGLFAFS
jgi:hypothetical protein